METMPVSVPVCQHTIDRIFVNFGLGVWVKYGKKLLICVTEELFVLWKSLHRKPCLLYLRAQIAYHRNLVILCVTITKFGSAGVQISGLSDGEFRESRRSERRSWKFE
jgi:hypothetical protein